jgi:ABC-type glycerol-3-phosphate transport system substrate-binding protein
MLLPLVSCKDNGDEGGGESGGVDFYITEELDRIRLDYIYAFDDNDGELVLVGQRNETVGSDNEIDVDYLVYTFDGDGNVISENELELIGDSADILCVDIRADGLAATVQRDYLTRELYYAVYGKDGGKPAGSVLLGVTEDEIISVSSGLVHDADGGFYILSNDKISVYDAKGELLFELQNDGVTINGIYKTREGGVFAARYIPSKSGCVLSEINLGGKAYGREYVIGAGAEYITGVGEYDLFECDIKAVNGLAVETGKRREIINWEKQNIEFNTAGQINNFKYVAITDDFDIFCLKFEYADEGVFTGGTFSLLRFKYVDSSRADASEGYAPDGRTVISLSSVSSEPLINAAVTLFNKNNTEYRIETKTYARNVQGSLEDAFLELELAATRFNLDLIAGNAPDIMVVNGLPYQSFADKGVFADLYEFIDKDPDVDRSDYLENILSALETDGKLYSVPPCFTVNTLIGKSSELGENPGWTWKEFGAALNKKPDNIRPIAGEMTFSRLFFFGRAFPFVLDSFIDLESGKCSFENEDFYEFLKQALRYPAKVDDSEYWIYSGFDIGDPWLMGILLSDFYTVKRYETALFKEDIVFKGYPASKGGTAGSSILPGARTAVSAQGKNKDAAWEFVKLLITDCQEVAGKNGFPIKISEYDRLMKEAKEKLPPTLDVVRVPVDSNNPNGPKHEIRIEPNTDDDNRKVFDFIKSLTVFRNGDVTITTIVEEEAAAYFAGQKPPEEVAAVIQNRVSLYLAETG